MKQTKVLIVDDHYFVRKGIEMFLEAESSIQVVGEAGNGYEAVRQAKELQPDVILMDLSMPQGDGVTATATIKHQFPHIKIIILTMHEHETKVIEAMVEAGADGYLLKEEGEDGLLQAIESVQQGDVPLHPRIARHLVKGATRQAKGTSGVVNLTEREKQVLQLLSKGLNNKEIGEALSVSSGTAKIHVSHILNKLNVSSRTEAAVQAIQLGLVGLNTGVFLG